MTAPLSEREPAAIGLGSLAVLVDLLVGLGAYFGWFDLTNEQAGVIIAFVTALAALVGALVRHEVWSPASVAALTNPVPPEVA